MKHKIPSKQELEAFLKDKSYKDGASFFKCSLRTLRRWLVKYDLTYEKLKHNYNLTKLQEDMIVACLLGDGYIDKHGRLKFKQKIQAKEYVEFVCNLLQPFSKKVAVCNNGNNDSAYFVTCNHSLLREFRKKWYPHGTKIVPNNLQLNPFIMSHWILQDGNNNQKKRAYNLYTNGFTEAEVLYLISIIKRDIGIVASKQKSQDKYTIAICARQYFEFRDIVKEYIEPIRCMKYKVTYDQAMPKQGWGAGKLDNIKAKEIRNLYFNDGLTQKAIAKIYSVHQASIGNVINNRSYASDFSFSGEAFITLSVS